MYFLDNYDDICQFYTEAGTQNGESENNLKQGLEPMRFLYTYLITLMNQEQLTEQDRSDAKVMYVSAISSVCRVLGSRQGGSEEASRKLLAEMQNYDWNQQLDEDLRKLGERLHRESVATSTRIREEATYDNAGDIRRRERKELLRSVLQEYTEAAESDSALAEIMKDVKEYIDIDAVATTHGYLRESQLSEKIYRALVACQEKLDQEALDADTYSYYERQTITANLLCHFDDQRSGSLVVPPESDFSEENVNGFKIARVDGIRRAPFTPYIQKKMDNDMPLFPHEPSPNDVRQGALGDCYLLNALSNVALREPERIRESMYDDGNGHVTVRFFGRTDAGDMYPVYVTVEKVVPHSAASEVISLRRNEDGGAYNQDSLWVQTYERAWAASGLWKNGKYTGRPVPDNVDEIYDRLKAQQSGGEPITGQQKHEYPWLFDKKGRLERWSPSYAAIEAGDEAALEAILGPEYAQEERSLFRESFRNPATRNDMRPEYIYCGGILEQFAELRKMAGSELSEQEMEWYRRNIYSAQSENHQEAMFRMLYYLGFRKMPPADENGTLLPLDRMDIHRVAIDQIQALVDTSIREAELIGKDHRVVKHVELPEIWDSMDQFTTAIRSKFDAKSKLTLAGYQYADEQSRVDAVHAVKLLCACFAMALKSVYNDRKKQQALNRRDTPKDAPIFTGEYNERALRYKERIEEAAKQGKFISCGFVEGTGLMSEHAYTIDKIVQKNVMVNGEQKRLHFVRVRNPWGGRKVRDYKQTSNGIEPYRGWGDNGFFDMELADFANYCLDLHVTGRKKEFEENRKDEAELEMELSGSKSRLLYPRAGKFQGGTRFALSAIEQGPKDLTRMAVLRCLDEGQEREIRVTVDEMLRELHSTPDRKTVPRESLRTDAAEKDIRKAAEPMKAEPPEDKAKQPENKADEPQNQADNKAEQPQKQGEDKAEQPQNQADNKPEPQQQADNKAEQLQKQADNKAEQKKQADNKPEQKKQAENEAEQKIKAQTEVYNIRRSYIQTLGSLSNCLRVADRRTDSASVEYQRMSHALKRLRRTLDSMGAEDETVTDAFAELGRAANDYIRHCRREHHHGSVRRERLAAAEKLSVMNILWQSGEHGLEAKENMKQLIGNKTLMEAVEHGLDLDFLDRAMKEENLTQDAGQTDAQAREHLAEMILDAQALSWLKKKNPEDVQRGRDILNGGIEPSRQECIRDILNSDAFHQMYDSMDARQLKTEIRRGCSKVFDQYKKVSKTLEKAAKHGKNSRKRSLQIEEIQPEPGL